MEVSRNHGYPLIQVIREQYRPEIRLLIMYYNNQFRLEQKEYEKMEKEMKKTEQKKNGG